MKTPFGNEKLHPPVIRMILLGVLSLFLMECKNPLPVMKGPEKGTPTGIIFDHKQHLGRGYTCGLCHQFLAHYDPQRPIERVCVFCHEIGDHAKPSPECFRCHTRPDFSAGSVPRPTYQDSKFKHQKHQLAEIPCQGCHKNQEKARNYSDIVFPGMKDCVSCHSVRRAGEACERCHKVWREDKKPENHDKLWLRRHGIVSIDRYENNCSYCHSMKTFCLDCHMAEKPLSHTLFFKNRGHGFWVQTDRMMCLPCHQQDFCLECHGPGSEVKPLTHTAGFGGNRPYLHCARCHFPAGEAYGCRACHNASTIHSKHLETTEEKSDPIPPFVLETSLDCLNCHPFDRVPTNHPIGALLNSDCLRCHSP